MRAPRRGHRIGAAIIAGALALVLAGCNPAAPPTTPASIQGVITAIDGGQDAGSVRIVWTDDAAIGAKADYDAAQVAVTADTNLFQAAEGRAQPIAFDELKLGDVVQAWFTGAVAESYPVQATASDLVRLGRYAGELPEPPGLAPPE